MAVQKWLHLSDTLVCCQCMEEAVSGTITQEDESFGTIYSSYHSLVMTYDALFSGGGLQEEEEESANQDCFGDAAGG